MDGRRARRRWWILLGLVVIFVPVAVYVGEALILAFVFTYLR